MDSQKHLTHDIQADEQQSERGESRLAEAAMHRRLSRAGLLKGAAALTAGVAGAGLYANDSQGALAAPAGKAALSGTTPLPGQEKAPAVLAPAFIATAGTTYTTFKGSDFTPVDSTSAFTYNGFDSKIGLGQFHVGLRLPQGAQITEAHFFVVYNDTAGMQFFLLSSDPSTGGGFTDFFSASPGAASGSIQTISMGIGTPVSVDNSTRAYSLRMGFNTNGQTQVLWGANVGWIHNPGLVTFSAPHRVFGNGTVLTPGTTGPIDATAGGVPAGASSAYCAIQANNPGVLTLFPDGAADPGIANWANTGAPGQLALFYSLVPLSSAGKFRIHNYFSGQIYADVWGYVI